MTEKEVAPGRVCNKCGQYKHRDSFNLDPRTALGLQSQCRECKRLRPGRKKTDADRAAGRRWKEKNRVKHNAQCAVTRAIRRGRLKVQPCERCGSTENIHAHHDDYAKRFDVRWLCALHHAEWHKINGEGLNAGSVPTGNEEKEMTDLSRERIKELRSKPSPGGWMGVDEAFALLDMAEQLLTLKSALGADAQTTTGFGGALERRPDWTQFDPALLHMAERAREQDAKIENLERALKKATEETHEYDLRFDVGDGVGVVAHLSVRGSVGAVNVDSVQVMGGDLPDLRRLSLVETMSPALGYLATHNSIANSENLSVMTDQDVGEEGIKRATARPLTTADEDRLKREAAAMALREVAVCLAALNFRPSMMGAHADELEDGR